MALPINRRLCRWQPLKILTGEACATPQCVENKADELSGAKTRS
jgi:hypothetical protein